MLEPADTYEQVVAGFRWQVPDRYNIAHSVCTRWAAERPDSIAIIEHMSDGPVRTTSFLQLEQMSNRFANLLKKSGINRGDRVALLLPQSRETAAAPLRGTLCSTAPGRPGPRLSRRLPGLPGAVLHRVPRRGHPDRLCWRDSD